MELSTPAIILAAFYRLVNTESEDAALADHGEALNDVAYQYLTRGVRAAQDWMLKMGYGGWRKRSAALTWLGTDDADGGRYVALPADFRRAFGNRRRSALTEAGGTRWGREIDDGEDDQRGDVYYIRGEQLWIGRGASPPTPAYLDYHYKHPTFSASVTMDFLMDARTLIVAEAANVAKEEDWLPGGADLEQKIERRLMRDREYVRGLVRQNKGPRQLRKQGPVGSRW